MYRAKTCILWDIALIFYSIGISQFFEVQTTPHPNRFFMYSMLYMVYSKTLLSIATLCKKVYFLRYTHIYDFAICPKIFENGISAPELLLDSGQNLHTGLSRWYALQAYTNTVVATVKFDANSDIPKLICSATPKASTWQEFLLKLLYGVSSIPFFE